MAWNRSGTPPKVIRIAVVVKAEDYPELADWWWSLPWGQGSNAVRSLLVNNAKAVANGEPDQSTAAVDKSSVAVKSSSPVIASHKPSPVIPLESEADRILREALAEEEAEENKKRMEEANKMAIAMGDQFLVVDDDAVLPKNQSNQSVIMGEQTSL
jgi:hypothetical protein